MEPKNFAATAIQTFIILVVLLAMALVLSLPRRAHGRDPEEPGDNELTPAKIALGRELFNEPLMSTDTQHSCASCHQPERGFTDAGPVSLGVGNQPGQIRAMSLLQLPFKRALFWNGRADLPEGQASQPILGAVELGNTQLFQPLQRLAQIQGYRDEWQKAFGHDMVEGFRPDQNRITQAAVGEMLQAIAAYERSALALADDTPVHKHLEGVPGAFDEQMARGWAVFEQHCQVCHSGSDFTDHQFHNIGVEARFNLSGTFNQGRFDVTKQDANRRAFVTPTLREVQRHGNYFHTGSAPTLRDVVNFENEPTVANAVAIDGTRVNPGQLDPRIDPQFLAQLKTGPDGRITMGLSEQDKDDLVYLLEKGFASPSYPQKFTPPKLPRNPQ